MIENISRYKRLFTFGCSFTRYLYPTWADVLSKEMPNATFYNLGASGAGNSYISWKIAEANNRFKFDQDDLVVVMYTTFCREDRFVDGWRLYGNVYNNNYYTKEFYKYTDPNGYAIQNLATIDLSMQYLKSLPCTSVFLHGMPLGNNETLHDIYDNEKLIQLQLVYPHIFDLPTSYFKFLHPNLSNTARYVEKGMMYKKVNGELFHDAHPSPIYAYEYLKYLEFPLSEISYNYALEETNICKQLGSDTEIVTRYKDYNFQMDKKLEGLFV